jgi:hypothetical protein
MRFVILQQAFASVRKQAVKKVDGALANRRRKWRCGAWVILSVDFRRRVRGGDGSFARRKGPRGTPRGVESILQ